MKTFLNVLYRKILYKIPLKFLLLLLAIFGFLFASCNAGVYTIEGDYSFNVGGVTNSYIQFIGVPLNINPSTNSSIKVDIFYAECTISDFNGDYSKASSITTVSVAYYNGNTTSTNGIFDGSYSPDIFFGNNSFTFSGNVGIKKNNYVIGIAIKRLVDNAGTNLYGTYHYNCMFSGDRVIGNQGNNSQYTSEECQTEYGLVESGSLISCETDLNSCINNTSGFNDLLNNCSNNLNACNLSLSSCLQNNCPTTSGDISWSSLFINDIQHIGGPSIYIGIPEEIERDYSYVDDDMYINVDGYNVDYDKIEGIIDVQNYKPSQEDFNNIIGILADYMPIIVIFLGLLFIYKMIRKPFKSKL